VAPRIDMYTLRPGRRMAKDQLGQPSQRQLIVRLPVQMPAPARRPAGRTGRAPAWMAAGGALAGCGLGAACMYWFDPDRGRSRRVRFRSHTRAALRRRARRARDGTSRQAHFLQGRLKGAAMRAAGHGRYHPGSDVDLREHLRQVIHSLPVSTGDVTVDVCAGRASLRGQVDSPEDQQLIRTAVAKCPGVDDVDDFLHLPGTPAPNKLAVLNVTAQNGAGGRQ
jgi:hypothetical protein